MIRRLRVPVGGEARLNVEQGPVLIEGYGNVYGPWAGVVVAHSERLVFDPPLAEQNSRVRAVAALNVTALDPLWA